MLKLTVTEFFIRVIPEMLVFVWGIYVVSNHKFNEKRYLIASIMMAIFTFIDRMLPIHYGIHTIMDNVFYITVSIIVINITLIKSVYSIFFNTILLGISEIVNIVLLNSLHIETIDMSKTPIRKSILGIPSLIIFAFLIFLVKAFLKRRKV